MKKKILLVVAVLCVALMAAMLLFQDQVRDNFTRLMPQDESDHIDSPLAKTALTKGDYLVLKRDIVVRPNSTRTVVEAGDCVFLFQNQPYPKNRVLRKGDKLQVGDVRPELFPTKPGVKIVKKFDFYAPCFTEEGTFVSLSVTADNGRRSPTLADFEELFTVSLVIERFR